MRQINLFIIVFTLGLGISHSAWAENICLAVYKEQNKALKKRSIFIMANPLRKGVAIALAAPLIGAGLGFGAGVEEAGSSSAPVFKALLTLPLGTALGTAGGTIASAFYILDGFIVSPFYRVPLSFYKKSQVHDIYKLLQEADELSKSRGETVMTPKLNSLSKKLSLYSTKRLGKVIQGLSGDGTLCPKGRVYTSKRIVETIIFNFMNDPSYCVPEKFYKRTKFYQASYKRWFDKSAKKEFEMKNSIGRFSEDRE